MLGNEVVGTGGQNVESEESSDVTTCTPTPSITTNVKSTTAVAMDVEVQTKTEDYPHSALKRTSNELNAGFSFPELLKIYYAHLFPHAAYYQWLSYGNAQSDYYCNREFSFTLKDDIYIRYQSFQDMNALKTALKDVCPFKIDIGAVYNTKPSSHNSIKASAFKPMEKELVFDIDMTDYDDIRTCCSKAKICELCWPFMNAAIKAMDAALLEDLGFKHTIWIYSGRRGVHAWVCDKRARKMSGDERVAVCEYLSLVTGSDQQKKKVNIPSNLHPSIARATRICEPYFESCVMKKQKLLQSEKHVEAILACIPDEGICKSLREKWSLEEESGFDESGEVSMRRWNDMKREINRKRSQKKNSGKSLNHTVSEIILQFTYPRLDINVSKQTHHLLKSPFSVHPKTGRVCTPIETSKCDSFDPFSVPTLTQLVQQINEFSARNKKADDSEDSKKSKILAYRETGMKPYVELFRNFVNSMQNENMAARQAVNSIEF